jgi:hypothetical protein
VSLHYWRKWIARLGFDPRTYLAVTTPRGSAHFSDPARIPSGPTPDRSLATTLKPLNLIGAANVATHDLVRTEENF